VTAFQANRLIASATVSSIHHPDDNNYDIYDDDNNNASDNDAATHVTIIYLKIHGK